MNSAKQLSSRSKLHGYQERMISHICTVPRSALWAEMGTGKSISTLTALRDLTKTLDVNRVLIVAPLRVAKTVWTDEIKQWPHVGDLDAKILAGLHPTTRRQAVFKDRSTIHIINRELIPWMVDELGKNWPYDTVVLDESSSFKNHTSKRWRALRKVTPYIHRLIELTGTPAPNGYLDLWAQIALLDGGQRLGRTYSQYRDRFFTSDYMGFNWTLKDGAREQIDALISDLCLSMRSEDYLELPPVVNNIIRVDLPPSARKAYKELERDFVLAVDSGEILAANAAALTNKLQQVASGFVYDEEKVPHLLHDEKLDALEEIIESTGGNPVLVAYTFVADVKRILKRFPKAEVLDKNPQTIERWNRGEIGILVAHPASAGHGLNIQHGGSTLVWYGLPWALELYQQMNARLHRQGQTKGVVIHHIVASDTVDETVVAALDRKSVTQNELLKALRDDAVRRM